MSLESRTKAIADRAKTEQADRLEQYVAREWWLVNGVEVFCCPPITRTELRRWFYPDGDIQPLRQ